VSVTVLEPGVYRADAMRFLVDAYDGVAVRPGKGLPHAQAVAGILGDAGNDEATQIVGLLHDVVEETPRNIHDVRAAFGVPTATMVGALTEDDTIRHYAQRKRALRRKIAAAGSPVVDVAVADKIATLHDALLMGTEVTSRKLGH
jgi:(p)ppGpp synthase/HD superfamily hydrolase